MKSAKSKSEASSASGPAGTPAALQAFLGKTGMALFYAGNLASAGSLVLGMLGSLLTFDLAAAEDGMDFLLMGVLVQVPAHCSG